MSENNEISLNHRDPLGIRSSTLPLLFNSRFHPPSSLVSELRASNTARTNVRKGKDTRGEERKGKEWKGKEKRGEERRGKERIQWKARKKCADGSNDIDVSESISFACYFAPYRGRKRRVLARRFIPDVEGSSSGSWFATRFLWRSAEIKVLGNLTFRRGANFRFWRKKNFCGILIEEFLVELRRIVIYGLLIKDIYANTILSWYHFIIFKFSSNISKFGWNFSSQDQIKYYHLYKCHKTNDLKRNVFYCEFLPYFLNPNFFK